MFGRGPLVRTCLAASILLVFAERGAAQVSGPYVSPQFPAKRVHVDPERARPTPSAAVKNVPEGGEHLPSQPPPRKLKESDPTIQLSSKDAPFEAQVGEAPSPNSMTAPLVNVPGIQSNAFPPDTVGDIGRNHYIQMTNAASSGGQTVFEIFDKTGNDLSGGPVRFGGLWPVGDACRSDLGDPIVVYDHLADRWLLSQFAGDPNNPTTVPAFMCIAISQTPNPTANTWFLYTILLPRFADYPKFGVWPDAYYMSSYEGANLGVFAFDRLSMLTGSATSFRKFTIGSLGTATVRDTRILPADLDGPAPAPGTPNFFVRPVDQQQDPVGVDRVEIYEFQANFATNTFNFALATTLTAPGDIAPFNIMTCNRGGAATPDVRDCIPEPDTTSTVDALSNRPMMQVKYRNFGTHEAMVFNQTIDVSGSINALLGFTPANEVAGIRWYTLRRSGGGAWGTDQQGTYAPQPNGATTEAQLLHRWMGSAAMDAAGNVALGYSIVNDVDTNGQEVFPGLRYSGRRFDDVPGTLPQMEQVILNGTNSETGGAGQRWGDYSAMSVDPVDDCTFYYTSHVATTTGGKPTRIVAFRFDTCGTDLRISKTDTPDPVVAGTQLRYDLTVTNAGALLAENVVVTDTLPTGVTYVSDTAGCTVAAPTLTCALGSILPGASSSFTITVLVSANAIADGITTLTNVAVVSSSSGETDPSNNTASASTTVIARADLQVSKVCKPDGPAAAGSTAHCDMQVDNLGPSAAQGVVLTDAITSSAPFTILSVTVTPSGSCLPAAPIGPTTSVTLTCNLGTMAAGTRTTVTVQFSATDTSDVNDTATVSSATVDPNPGNNVASGHVSFVGSADLVITKSAPASANLASTFDYVVSVDNLGPSSASNVVVTDALPAGAQYVSATASVGTFTVVNGTITWNLGTVAVADPVRTLTVTVKVLPTSATLVNNASVTSSTADPNTGNNLATTTTQVVGTDLWIAKSGTASAGNPSGALTYSITVYNVAGSVADATPTSGTGGPNPAQNVVVVDPLPLDNKKVSVQFLSPGCTYASGTHTVTCSTPTVAAGASVTFEIQIQINGSVGTVTNTATVSSSTFDPDPSNNTDTVNNVVKGGTGKGSKP